MRPGIILQAALHMALECHLGRGEPRRLNFACVERSDFQNLDVILVIQDTDGDLTG